MMLLAILLLSDVVAAELPRSDLVSEDHTHEWSVIDREKAEIMLLDQEQTADYSDGENTYKTVLIRGSEPDRDGSVYFVDFLVAIDCERSMLAPIGYWEPKLQNETPKLRTDEIGKFVQANDKADEKVLTAVFQHICGPKWKFEPR
ncbi:hypothetical protein [Erythrobacter sp. F6033]|uniref:hypothetical protein n=1 Tax=Erythrobacter sp. F6033 TaxID=2926401 RepID=UPI001FF2CF2E|nr:hypothetical protein [Erythrobacter sp. F6033]MCK0127417.1 hypothetical protein [Erythrobacter sp. F6033]